MKKILAIIMAFVYLSAPSASAAWEFDEIPLNTYEYVAYLPKNSESNKLLVGKPYIEYGRYVVYWSPTQLISFDGEVLIDDIETFDEILGYYLINNNLYDGDFNKLSDEEYNSMSEFDNGCLLLAKYKEGEKKKGYVVADGKGEVISTEVICSESATIAGDYILVEGSDGNYIADLHGKRVSDIFSENGVYKNNENIVLFDDKSLAENDTIYKLEPTPEKLLSEVRYINIFGDSIIMYAKQGKCVFYDLDEKKEIFSCDAVNILKLVDDYILIQADENSGIEVYECTEKKVEYKGYINISPENKNIGLISADKKRVLYEKQGDYADRYTLCNFDGNVLWEGEIDGLNLVTSFFTTDKMVIRNRDGIYRHIGLDGTLLYEGEDYIEDFDGKLIKQEDGKRYLCDIYGNKIVNEEISGAEKMYDSDYVRVTIKNSDSFNNTGVINEDGSFLIEPIYGSIEDCGEHFEAWTKQIDDRGRYVLDIQHYKTSFLSKDGRLLSEMQDTEEQGKRFLDYKRLISVSQKGRVGGIDDVVDYLDIKGESIFEEDIDSALTEDGTLFVVKRKDGTKAVLIPKESYVCVKLNDGFCKDGIIRDDRILVPMRNIFERLGYTVEWDGKNESIDAYCGEKHIHMEIGNNEIISDGKVYYSDKSPEIIKDMTYIPVGVLMESLGAEVDWYEDLRLVDIQL